MPSSFDKHLSIIYHSDLGHPSSHGFGKKSLLVPRSGGLWPYGTAHLLSVSGLHIDLWRGSLQCAAALAARQAPSSVLTAAIAWVYALITGAIYPWSGTTLAFYLGAGILGRSYHRRRLQVGQHCCNYREPSLVFDASFQLSTNLLGIINIAKLAEAISSICGLWKRPSRLVTRGIDIMVLS